VVRPADHPVDALFRAGRAVAPYPEGTEAVPARIVGTAFFPGGSGLWREPSVIRRRGALPPLLDRGIMIVGQDFHSRAQYERSLGAAPRTWRRRRGSACARCSTPRRLARKPASTRTRTWACARPADRWGRTRAARTLRSPRGAARSSPSSSAWCGPRVVVALGLPAARMLGALAPEALGAWDGARTFRALDEAGAGLVRGVAFPGTEGVVAHAVALVHPSYGRLNVRNRRYARTAGEVLEDAAAERALFDDALEALGADRYA
jgi:hypothetical protein